MLIRIKQGLDLPIGGAPQQVIDGAVAATHVALLGKDYPGLKPELKVDEGDAVKLGETLCIDRRTGIRYNAPAGGVVININRGPKRSLQSIVIRVEGDEQIEFPAYSREQLSGLGAAEIKTNMLEAGLWTAFRTRPFNRIPDPATAPHSVFVTAIDTEPLAADPAVIIAAYAEGFMDGMTVLSRLFDVDVFVCCAPGAVVPLPDSEWIRRVDFAGPHPAGLVGTHIHHLDPVGAEKTVWHLNYQDVIGIGRLFTHGRLWTSRIIALAGTPVLRPRLLPITVGSAVADIVAEELGDGDCRIISGSVLSGRTAFGQDGYLGRYHTQISVVDEVSDTARQSHRGTLKKFTQHGVFSRLLARRKKYYFNTAMNGAKRPLIPLGQFEQVMPLDILATPLLKSLLINDSEAATALGCLELAEEDLALCEFVCCSKHSYGAALRRRLSELETGRA